jgi:hypothetical protein
MGTPSQTIAIGLLEKLCFMASKVYCNAKYHPHPMAEDATHRAIIP